MPIPLVSWEVGSSSFALLISALATLEISLVPGQSLRKGENESCSGFFRQSALYPLAMDVAQLLDVLSPRSAHLSAHRNRKSASSGSARCCRIENCARLQRRTHHPPQNHFRRLFENETTSTQIKQQKRRPRTPWKCTPNGRIPR